MGSSGRHVTFRAAQPNRSIDRGLEKVRFGKLVERSSDQQTAAARASTLPEKIEGKIEGSQGAKWCEIWVTCHPAFVFDSWFSCLCCVYFKSLPTPLARAWCFSMLLLSLTHKRVLTVRYPRRIPRSGRPSHLAIAPTHTCRAMRPTNRCSCPCTFLSNMKTLPPWAQRRSAAFCCPCGPAPMPPVTPLPLPLPWPAVRLLGSVRLVRPLPSPCPSARNTPDWCVPCYVYVWVSARGLGG